MVFENYKLGESLAKGGEGTVYLCRKLKDGVALEEDLIMKIIPAASPQSLSKSLDECKMVFSLDSPYFVQYRDYFLHATEEELAFCIVMPKYSMDLANYLQKGTLSVKSASRLCLDLLSGLFLLHSKGITHRDMKPENVLVDTKNEVSFKISDFGLAFISNEMNRMKTLVGTVQYQAPELQEEGKSYTSKIDIFSFGVLLYQALTKIEQNIGYMLLEDENALDTLEDVSNYGYPSLFMEIIKDSLVYNPEQRSSAAKLLEDYRTRLQEEYKNNDDGKEYLNLQQTDIDEIDPKSDEMNFSATGSDVDSDVKKKMVTEMKGKKKHTRRYSAAGMDEDRYVKDREINSKKESKPSRKSRAKVEFTEAPSSRSKVISKKSTRGSSDDDDDYVEEKRSGSKAPIVQTRGGRSGPRLREKHMYQTEMTMPQEMEMNYNSYQGEMNFPPEDLTQESMPSSFAQDEMVVPEEIPEDKVNLGLSQEFPNDDDEIFSSGIMSNSTIMKKIAKGTPKYNKVSREGNFNNRK